MHLNYHTAYPRLSVNYFRKKLHHRCELQNTRVILDFFNKKTTTHKGTRKIFHFTGRESL